MNLFNFFNFFSHAHSEIAYNGADAKPCLSDVYKNSTRAKRRQADVPLCGRSMVEMLGVLAIIGVLSVGAISGYSKAMLKYNLNKQAEQINQLINITYTYGSQINVTDTQNSSFIPYFEKLNLIPDGMKATQNSLTDALKTNIAVFQSPGATSKKLVYIALTYSSNMDRSTTLQSCIQISELAKDYSISYERDFYALYLSNVDGEGATQGRQEFFGSSVVSNCKNSRCLKYASVNDIYNACSDALDKNLYLSIIFYFR